MTTLETSTSHSSEPSRSTVPLGKALEGARRRVQFSVESAASHLGIDTRELGLYECGLRTPDAEMLRLMGSLYGVDPDRLESRPYLPRVPPRIDRTAKTLSMGWMTIDLSPVDDNPAQANEYLVRSIAGSLRTMRGLDVGQPVYLRRSELPLLAALLDTTDNDLPVLLMRYLSLSYSETLQLVASMEGSIFSSSQQPAQKVA